MFKHIILATFAVAVASAAHAQPAEIQTVKVSVAGLNAQSPSGARIVLQRIESAARKVCGAEPTRDLARARLYDPCVDEVIARTVAGQDNPTLAALINRTSPSPAKLASAR